jgi:hypothetical protein
MMSKLRQWHVLSQELAIVIERWPEDGHSTQCNEIRPLHLVEVSGDLQPRAFAIC